jgi:hypothetical protein
MVQNDNTGQINQPIVNPSNSSGQSSEEAVQNSDHTLPKQYNSWSIVLLVLLLLTFFSPLGSALFLPIVLVGLAGAVWHTQSVVMKTPKGTHTPQKVIFSVLKVLILIGVIFVLGIVALIGLFFLLIGTGAIDFNMGS